MQAGGYGIKKEASRGHLLIIPQFPLLLFLDRKLLLLPKVNAFFESNSFSQSLSLLVRVQLQDCGNTAVLSKVVPQKLKATATMPIGIVGSNSSAKLD